MKMGQDDVVLVVDQAIYCKVQELVWAKPEEFKRIVPWMGAFHISYNLLAVFGHRFGDAGLADLLV